MNIIKTNYGQPSYNIFNEDVSVLISIQGGHLTASFKTAGGDIEPFFIPPWWKESNMFELDNILKLLRGNFFCFPFGANENTYEGNKYPIHGQTCNDNWDFVEIIKEGCFDELKLKMELNNNAGEVFKHIKISKGEPVIYENNTVSKFSGKAAPGYHPTIVLPGKIASAYLDISKPVAGFTLPSPGELPEKGGYSLLKSGIEINDMGKIPDVFGGYIDLNKIPICKGFEDYAIFINDASKDFTYTAVSFPEDGYLYFQLKDPKVFCSTFFWMSNGGRHYFPWNGRISSVMGLEEITAFFHYGVKESVEQNFLQEKGYKTCMDLSSDKTYEFKIIMGLVPIEKDFNGVKDITAKDECHVSIEGKNGSVIDVPCRTGFLKD